MYEDSTFYLYTSQHLFHLKIKKQSKTVAILVNVNCYLSVIWTHSSLKTGGVEKLIMSLLVIFMFSLEKYVLKPFAHF